MANAFDMLKKIASGEKTLSKNSEEYKKAVAKLEAEMQKKKNVTFIQILGQYLLNYLSENPTEADKILEEGKSIASGLKEIERIALKGASKENPYGFVSDQDGYNIVLRHFKILEDNSFVEIKSDPAIEQNMSATADDENEVDDDE